MVNKVILIGNLGKDPEVRNFENNSVANFSLATSETYTDKNGERQTLTEWHNISVWGRGAETVQKYLKKGSKVYIEGKITYRKYQDKDGVDRYTTDIKADTFKFLDSAGGNNTQGGENFGNPQQQQQQQQNKPSTPDYNSDGDDLPF